jgi:hypothetical protein
MGVMAVRVHLDGHQCNRFVPSKNATGTNEFKASIDMEQFRIVQGSKVCHPVLRQFLERIWV